MFLDTMVYNDHHHKILTTILRKPKDGQTYLHAQSNHHRSLKNCFPYSQVLRIKTISSTTSEFNKSSEKLKRLKERGYLEKLMDERIDKMKNLKRKQLLSTDKRTIQNHISVLITYNRFLSNMSNITAINWIIFQVSPTL